MRLRGLADPADVVLSCRDVCLERGPVRMQRLNMAIPRGCITAIMGPSGTGKSTLLGVMSAQIALSSGSVVFNGIDLSTASRQQVMDQRKRMGFLLQGGGLFTDMSVYDNVAFPLYAHTDLPNAMIRDLVMMMLQAVGLRGAAAFQVHELSGGMARRVALARAIIMGPELMFYDEPFAGQDPISKGAILSLIQEMNKALQMTSVLVSHDISETAKIADYLYLVYRGEIVAQGPPSDVLSDPTPLVRQFIDGAPDGPLGFHMPTCSLAEELFHGD